MRLIITILSLFFSIQSFSGQASYHYNFDYYSGKSGEPLIRTDCFKEEGQWCAYTELDSLISEETKLINYCIQEETIDYKIILPLHNQYNKIEAVLLKQKEQILLLDKRTNEEDEIETLAKLYAYFRVDLNAFWHAYYNSIILTIKKNIPNDIQNIAMSAAENSIWRKILFMTWNILAISIEKLKNEHFDKKIAAENERKAMDSYMLSTLKNVVENSSDTAIKLINAQIPNAVVGEAIHSFIAISALKWTISDEANALRKETINDTLEQFERLKMTNKIAKEALKDLKDLFGLFRLYHQSCKSSPHIKIIENLFFHRLSQFSYTTVL